VECRQDLQDQRVSRVHLTEAGRAIRTSVHQVWNTLDKEAFDGFTVEERTLLRRFFLRVRENLKHVVGGA